MTTGLDSKSKLSALSDEARKTSELLKALAHESRLMILCLLSEGEKSVTELEEMLVLPQPTVSQQLARLRLDGLVTTRRDGRTIYYALAGDEIAGVIAALYELFCKRVLPKGSG